MEYFWILDGFTEDANTKTHIILLQLQQVCKYEWIYMLGLVKFFACNLLELLRLHLREA